MGKRSSFERIAARLLPDADAAVPPLIPHLRGVRTFAEPCCGDGALVRHLESYGLRCVYAGDIADRPGRARSVANHVARETPSLSHGRMRCRLFGLVACA